MAKQKTAKKKGPKGKKARAKAKLERQWGETAIVDDEKPRRVGNSRLLARSKKSQENNQTIRWAPDDRGLRESGSNNSGNQTKPGTSGVLKNNEPKYQSKKWRDNHNDNDNFGSDTEGDSEDEDAPVIQGLLSSIRKTKNKSEKPKKKSLARQADSQSDNEEVLTDTEMVIDANENESSESGEDSSDDDINDGTIYDHDDDESVVDLVRPGDEKLPLDLFHQRFSRDPLKKDELESTSQTSSSKVSVDGMFEFQVTTPSGGDTLPSPIFDSKTTPDDLKRVSESAFENNRSVLQRRWKRLNKSTMTEAQFPIYPFLARYMDAFMTTDSRKHQKELHKLYTLHVLNHVLTSRGRVQRHNREIKELETKAQLEKDNDTEKETDPMDADVDQERFRDQGFTRPTVLVLLPTRGTCHKFVSDLMKMVGAEGNGPHAERFDAEFGKPVDEDDEDDHAAFDAEKERRRKAVLQKKGKDWNDLFGDGVNQDDDFKVGIALTPKAAKGKGKDSSPSSSNVQVKLYTDFYKSDIIVASPLGLKMLIAPDEEGNDGDSDYLSSIEICLVPFADVLMMQNWDHANDIFALLNKEPGKNNDTDFSRVRNYILEGQAQHWRQLIFSADIVDPFLLSSFKRFGKSVSGSVKMRRKVQPEEAALSNVLVPMKQVFQRVPVPSFEQQTDCRVSYFMKNILPQIQRHKQKHTMVYIPSYFDFVALRNMFLKREIAFVSVHEYSRVTEVSRGRARFLQGRKPIMLFTGRANFFHRHDIKGVRHLIFLGLPEHPQFYADHVNLINTGIQSMLSDDVDAAGASSSSCLALFTRFEGHALERVVGTTNCSRMLKSDKTTFMFHS